MNLIYPSFGLLLGLLAMVSAYYLFSWISWLLLGRLIPESVGSGRRADLNSRSSFIAHRVKVGRSFFGIRDCFFRVSSHLDGIDIMPWLPMPRSSRVFVPWSGLSLDDNRPLHQSHSLIGATVGDTQVSILVTSRQLESLLRDGLRRDVTKPDNTKKSNKSGIFAEFSG